jgi:threonylcarbamoyladenosine tRNA methylthiotransferase MtaB
MKTINPSIPLRIDDGRRRSIKFFTLGCKVNQYETQLMREGLLKAGYKELENSKPSDFYVINTCTVTHRADSESFNLIRRARRENPKARVIVTGCLAELDSDRIKKTDSRCIVIKNSDKDKISYHPNGISYFKGHTRAFLKIQDGCNNFCSYCKVPLVRGASRSRPLEDIVKEAKALVKNNYKEIVLTGICLGSYGKDLSKNSSLVKLIGELESIEGLTRIRLSSIEACDVTDKLVQRFSVSRKLCRHLHIPIQSGDDTVLKRMNRRYSAGDYLNIIDKVKQAIPEIAITTDCLVGFPGETEEQFQNTLGLIKLIEPLKVHTFPYSKREGTLAAENFKDQISPVVIKKRKQVIQKVALNSAHFFKRRFLNKYMDVLVEKKEQGFWTGLTDNYIKVAVKSEENLENKIIRLKLKRIEGNRLITDSP